MPSIKVKRADPKRTYLYLSIRFVLPEAEETAKLPLDQTEKTVHCALDIRRLKGSVAVLLQSRTSTQA